MLIKVTNFCSLGCSHCMEGSTRREKHMPIDVFEKALDFTMRVEGLAHSRGYRLALLSGGECTEHPDILKLIEMVEAKKLKPLLISNGMWLNDESLKAEILRPGREIFVQITNDKRFYPKAPPVIDDPRVVYIDALTHMMPIGRFTGKTHPEIPERKYPASFNLRSLTRSCRDIRVAIAQIRVWALSGSMGGHCAPSITNDGTFVAGENLGCFKIGTVDSSVEEVTQNLLEMRSCNRCTLERNLDQAHRRAIGIER